MSVPAAVSLRPAYPDDDRALERLAALDCGRAPRRPALVAEQDGELRAALGLIDGRLVADPFRPTAGIIDLLRLHARRSAEG